MPSIVFDRTTFMDYLMAKCNFSVKGAEWACIWVEKFLRFYPDWSENREKAIAGFSEALSRRKPANIVNLALRSVRLFIAFMEFELGERGQARSVQVEKDESISKQETCSISAFSEENPEETEDREWQEWASRIMKQVRELIRLKHRSLRTEKTYLGWTRRFFDFLRKTRLAIFVGGAPKITADHLRAYLSYLAVDVRVSASTQEQALNALLILFRSVLHIEIEGLSSVLRAKKRKRLPVVLSRDEVSALLAQLRQPYRLMGSLM